MKKFNVGDKVKIIQRKKNNTSGTEPGFNKPNGNVGEIGYVRKISGNYCIYRTKDKEGYFGWFDKDDLELVSEEVSTTPYVKGKWYGCKGWNSPVDFLKLERVYDGQAYFTECLNAGNYQKERQNWWSIVGSELFEADMSIVSQFLPEGHPDKIGSEEFVLPEKWCIKLTKENVDVLGKWRSAGPLPSIKYAKEGWYLHTPKHGANGYNEPSKDPDYTEITFEQFKQHVLKESPVVEIPKEIDMKAIQEEAKKRFPIGCEFIPVDSDKTYTLIKDEYTYDIYGMNIWAHYGVGCLYENGEWAILVSLPETKEEESIPEYVECVKKYGGAKIGTIYKTSDKKEASKLFGLTWEKVLIKYKNLGDNFIPSTKEAYEAQFKEKKLTKEKLVEGEIYIYDGLHISTYPEGPSLAIKEKFYEPNPNWLWTLSITHATEEQKALLRSEIEKRSEKMEKEEWEPGTYAVGVKGNFGVYKGSKNPIPVGHIYTIKENRKDDLVLEGSQFWVYKENLKWFATREEAETFSKGLITGDITIDSSEKVKPISQLWIEDPIVEERINTSSIKKETFIDNVQSVNVMLRTKRKSIKF